MKKCKHCNEEKPLSEFHKSKITSAGNQQYKSYCKSCDVIRHREYNRKTGYASTKKYFKNNPKVLSRVCRKWQLKQKDGFHYIYYLPEEHYIGVTDCIKHRMYTHKNNNKRYVNNVETVYKTSSRAEAEKLEEILHNMGYNG